MKYRLVYTHRASRDIQGLEENVKRRIGKALKRYGEEPLKYASKLTDPRLGTYRFRIGDYRVIFDLEGDEIFILWNFPTIPLGHFTDERSLSRETSLSFLFNWGLQLTSVAYLTGVNNVPKVPFLPRPFFK